MYLNALDHPKVIGLVIGTRPDCMTDELIDFLSLLARDHFIALEFGIESTSNSTLLAVNRCHTFEDSRSTIEKCSGKGFHIGAHLILGLPGESEETMLHHAKRLSALPIDTLKLHHLQIVKHAAMAVDYRKDPSQFKLFSVDSYIEFVSRFLAILRPDIIIERFISEAPSNLLIAPKWGLKNFEMVNKIDRYLERHDIWQGMHFNNN